MDMKTKIVSMFLLTALFVSCKKEAALQESLETPVVQSTAPATQIIEKEFEVQAPNTPTNQVPNSVQMKAAPTAAGMNPAHGQPNHRCDIAVGAPVSTPKVATPPPAPIQPIQPTQSVVVPNANSTEAVITKPGMNPPHGQEGHRCEVAVGAPLPK